MKFLIVFLVLIVAALAAPQFGNYFTSEKIYGIVKLRNNIWKQQVTTLMEAMEDTEDTLVDLEEASVEAQLMVKNHDEWDLESSVLTFVFPQLLLLHNHLEAVSAVHSEDSQDPQQTLKLDLQALDLENNLLASTGIHW
jgi:hypothetical protein